MNDGKMLEGVNVSWNDEFKTTNSTNLTRIDFWGIRLYDQGLSIDDWINFLFVFSK